ncbi:uncharacterized protein SAPINGB_P000452 [Magnusiomyces paraingens]|uniref:F-box domain-containing protein n=1 Tax=Magnusiomyces paraingens TaxID=2606893 RepID=A0A5E8B0T2_9ASCO|nr:uncharacterized protein SAPINGB_P000452 [Saprochaete ingens]VVT44545.1 unnamed protein product [Saprochaete ingens]
MNETNLITTKIDDLPPEVHICLSEYLNSDDCINMSRTNSKLRDQYKYLKWRYCLVVPHPHALKRISTNFRTIPFICLRKTKKYSWIPFHLIKTLELHQTTNLEFSDLYLKIYEHVIEEPFPRELITNVDRVIVNLHHSASVSFFSENWGKSLMEQKLGWPKLEVRRLPIEASDYLRESDSDLEFEYLLEHEWVEKYNNNLFCTSLLAKCVNILFKSKIDFITPNLRFLTTVITEESSFSFNTSLPHMAPALEKFELIWIIDDSMNPGKRVPQAISSLGKLDTKSFPNLRRCSITIPKKTSSYSNDYLPEPDRVVVRAPIVTHIIINSPMIDISQFHRYFKFPNLHMMSLVVTSHIRYSEADFVCPLPINKELGWNRPKLLELIINNNSPFNDNTLKLLKYIIVDLSITQLKLTIDVGFKRNTRHICESLSFQSRALPVSKETMSKYARELVQPTALILDKLNDENIIDRFKYFNSMENIHVLTYIIAMGIGEPSSISEEDIEFAIKEIYNKKNLDRVVHYGMFYEEILHISSKNKSIQYINIDFRNPRTKVYSSELYFLSKMPIYTTKQILLTFNLTHREIEEENWKTDLPGVPWLHYNYGKQDRYGDTPVQVCINTTQQGKLIDPYYLSLNRHNSYNFWKPLNEVDVNFDGWF